MISDELAKLLAASIARHQSRGLVDDATGLADVVIHGRVDMLAVAEEVLVEHPNVTGVDYAVNLWWRRY